MPAESRLPAPAQPWIAALLAVLLAVAPASNALAQAPTEWRVGATPTLTLGRDEGDPEALLNEVVSATRLADGSVLVSDRGEFAFKIFGPDGTHRKSYARHGSGPGEVRYLGWMLRCGDRLYSYDIQEGHRVTVFQLDGRYLRDFRFRTPAGQQVPYRSACNADGRFAHLGWDALTNVRGGLHRSNVPVWTTLSDSSAAIALDSVPGSERWGVVEESQLVGSRPLPLGRQPVIGIGRTRIYVGSADRFEVNVYDLGGKREAPLRAPLPQRPVTPADVRAEIDRAVAEAGESRRARIERAYSEITFPTVLPAYTALLVDSEDQVWVRAYAGPASPTADWYVFAATGALRARVKLPRELEVSEVGRDYVLGRRLDPDESVPLVEMYSLSRTP